MKVKRIIRNTATWPKDRPANRLISSQSETVQGEAFTEAELMARAVAQGNIELSPIQLKADVPLYLIVIGKHLKQIQLDL